jgi:glucose-1-phosphate thymidylyltransferase
MWGIVPAAGTGSRIQPLAFSKELLPVGSRHDGQVERPRAASEYLVERMLLAGVTKICFVISPGKFDIMQYYGGGVGEASICYAVQQSPAGLCDALFRALPLMQTDEFAVVGLPDTIWFPQDALQSLGSEPLSFLLFPVLQPELFDAVLTDHQGHVLEIQVKQQNAGTNWIWGAFKLSGAVLQRLHDIWVERGKRDEYIGPLVNEYLRQGGRAVAVKAGEAYVDVGTLNGYRQAISLLGQPPGEGTLNIGSTPGSPQNAAHKAA